MKCLSAVFNVCMWDFIIPSPFYLLFIPYSSHHSHMSLLHRSAFSCPFCLFRFSAQVLQPFSDWVYFRLNFRLYSSLLTLQTNWRCTNHRAKVYTVLHAHISGYDRLWVLEMSAVEDSGIGLVVQEGVPSSSLLARWIDKGAVLLSPVGKWHILHCNLLSTE